MNIRVEKRSSFATVSFGDGNYEWGMDSRTQVPI